MRATESSDYVDFILSESEEITAIGDFESYRNLKASLKRRMSYSSMEDIIDHAQLHASIERDILRPTRSPQGWSFSKSGLSKPSTRQRQSKIPFSSQDSDIKATQQSSQTTVGSEFAPRQATASPNDLESSRASSFGQTEEVDLQILGSEPSSSHHHSAKRRRHILSSAMLLPPGDARPSLQTNQRRLILPNTDYRDDEERMGAFIRSTANPADIEPTEQLPDSTQEIIDLEADEAAEEAEEIEDEATKQFMLAVAVDENDLNLMNIIEIFSDDDNEPEPRRPHVPASNRRQSAVRITCARMDNLRLDEPLASVTHGMHTFKPGDGIEFHSGTFMRIKAIYRNRDGHTILSGLLLTRWIQHCLDPRDPKGTQLLPSKGRLNELVWTVTIDGRTNRENELVERELCEVMGPREINLTNQTWPCISSQIHTGGVDRNNIDHIYRQGPLFCRWKRVKQIQLKRTGQDYEDCIVKLTEAEADAKQSIKPLKLRNAARRQHVPTRGGNSTHSKHFKVKNGSMQAQNTSQITFADCFCGCGGASKGAEMAGLAIQWALDYDEKAARSYRANFRSATCHQEDVFDFLAQLEEPGVIDAHIVDVLHMSPPCQAFSLARTGGSEEAKEAIQAVITSVGELLKKVKPRFAIVEQTSGLFYANKNWMAHVIREMIDAGYSVQWKIMESQFWGVPQVRKRLVIVAAGPGETPPPWPKPTHGPQSAAKRPLATVHDAISKLPPTASHNKVISKFKDGRPKLPFSPHTQARTITCGGLSGNESYHPSGLRPYTVRELACLQTFPRSHSFANANLTTAKKQTGNAFPPKLAEAVYREIIKSIKETDGVR